MPDWQKLVREQLAGLNRGHEEEDEVIAELAGHLEETYEALRRDGLPELEAVHRALSSHKLERFAAQDLFRTRQGEHYESTDKPSLAP
jgi:hypothetical protein